MDITKFVDSYIIISFGYAYIVAFLPSFDALTALKDQVNKAPMSSSNCLLFFLYVAKSLQLDLDV
jgi:hypothetical protein